MEHSVNQLSFKMEHSVNKLSSKSILRYPGGKSRAVKVIKKYIPKGIETICSPFLGGASLEISCAADGIKVFGSDAFLPLVDFWKEVLKNPLLLSLRVRDYYPMSKNDFYNIQSNFETLDNSFERAAAFYSLNRCSFSGSTLSGGMSPKHPRFNENAIERLKNFNNPNLFVSKADYKEALMIHKEKFLYLDPPYANGEKLYGDRGNLHDGFNHEELAEVLKKRDGWILSYNDCPEIRFLYSKYLILTPEWTYGMSSKKESKELLICSY